ncbi:MAG: aldehyde dehydrogenase EutE [Desulfovibrio sp.]|nr:aldehyde dehydrogenase EutE [Desulfovibrio sp.]
MEMQEQDVERIVSEVLKRLGTPGRETPVAAQDDLGLFASLDDAVEAASRAYRKVSTLRVRREVIAAIRKAGKEHAQSLAELAVRETGMGRVADKLAKNILQAESTPGPEALVPRAMSGDAGLALEENAPWGVVASVTPSTNPAATVVNNAISMISAGNAVVFAPHPNAKQTSQTAMQTLNKAIRDATGIEHLLCAVREPSIETAQRLFAHPGVKLLVVTGGEGVVAAARKHATMRLIAAGAGNPPTVVDETADIPRAAKGILAGASFDNNIICADEKEIIAVDAVADRLKRELAAQGACEITLPQAETIARFALRDHPGPSPAANPKWVGRDASRIAREADIHVPDTCRMLFVDVGRDIDHPFARVEQMMPVLPLLRARNVDEAIEWALILERGLSHTAGIHSRNIDNMHAMALAMNTSLFVKNGPHVAALGVGGEGWTSMTISTPTGEGVTSARTFVRIRRCVLVDSFRIV